MYGHTAKLRVKASLILLMPTLRRSLSFSIICFLFIFIIDFLLFIIIYLNNILTNRKK